VPHPKRYQESSSNEKATLLEEGGDHYNTFDDKLQEGSDSPLSWVLGVLCFPLTLCGSWYTVQENEEVVTLNYGKYTGVQTEPGIHWRNMWGRELIPISKAKVSMELPVTKVIDLNGNPVMVSGVVFYHYKDTAKAALYIMNREEFIRDIATAVMKQIVSHYPYEVNEIKSKDDDSDEEVACLKRDASVVSKELVDLLQKQVTIAGVYVDSFQFNEISYAPEIAAGMLKKQQAQSIVRARSTLVDGAVGIAVDVIDKINKRGVEMQQQERAILLSNLLTVVCADEQVHPVLPLGC